MSTRERAVVTGASSGIGAATARRLTAEGYDGNVVGLVQVTRALLPALVAIGAGTIVNVGSTAGRVAYEGGGGYPAAKHGTKVVTETLRLELFDQPARACEVAPGMVKTDELVIRPRAQAAQHKVHRVT